MAFVRNSFRVPKPILLSFRIFCNSLILSFVSNSNCEIATFFKLSSSSPINCDLVESDFIFSSISKGRKSFFSKTFCSFVISSKSLLFCSVIASLIISPFSSSLAFSNFCFRCVKSCVACVESCIASFVS